MLTKVLTTFALGMFVAVGLPAHAGVEPEVKCKDAKAKEAGKKALALMKALGKNLKKPDDAKLAADLSKAQSRLAGGFAKAESKGSCETTGDAASVAAKVDTCMLGVMDDLEVNFCGDNRVNEGNEQCDGTDDSACPGQCRGDCTCPEPEYLCGNVTIESGEECDPPGEQGICGGGEVCTGFCECETIAACDCGSPEPTGYKFTTKAPLEDACGVTEDGVSRTLACQGLYIGGGGGALIPPAMTPDEGTTRYNITSCNGTNLVLGHTTAVQVGERECGEGKKCSAGSDNAGDPCQRDRECPNGTCETRCFFGAPLPILDRALAGLSMCVISEFSQSSYGGVNCETGKSFLRLPLDWRVHLTWYDQSSTIPGHQPCPICVGGALGVPGSGTCEGGARDGLACEPEDTAYDLGDCCGGGLRIGSPCSDDSDCPGSECTSGCTVYATSHDCRPHPSSAVAVVAVPVELTTETSTESANAKGGFCGWCYDVEGEGSLCFEGDPNPGQVRGCPDSAVIACDSASGVDMGECGDAVPCKSDADCAAPYESCDQRRPGAFRDASVRTISYGGTRPGSLKNHSPRRSTVVSAFCIPPVFVPAVDVNANLGGPGGLSLEGEAQLY